MKMCRPEWQWRGAPILCSLAFIVFQPGPPAIAQDREGLSPQDTDILITVDHRGTAGYHLVNWNRD